MSHFTFTPRSIGKLTEADDFFGAPQNWIASKDFSSDVFFSSPLGSSDLHDGRRPPPPSSSTPSSWTTQPSRASTMPSGCGGFPRSHLVTTRKGFSSADRRMAFNVDAFASMSAIESTVSSPGVLSPARLGHMPGGLTLHRRASPDRFGPSLLRYRGIEVGTGVRVPQDRSRH